MKIIENLRELTSWEALKENPEIYRFIEEFFDNLSDGIIITDRDFRVVIYNYKKEIQENLNRKDMLGKYIWDAYGYQNKEESEHFKVFKSGQAIRDQYSAHSFVDGKPKYINYSTYPLEIDGEILGVYSISKNEDSLHESLISTIERKKKHLGIEKEVEDKYLDNGTRYDFSNIIGQSPEMKQVINTGQTISFLDNSILIYGETGTGKEVLAQSIHNYGDRYKEPFIGINCSAIPENLLESILFGTVKGAYTGAVDSDGLFIKAKRGTLFLDDINTMPQNLQAKLLRVIQEKQVSKLGSSKTHRIECRIISATNEDPFKLMDQGKLREDLYYRIAGFLIKIPPLRERKKDIIELVEYFIRRYSRLLGKEAIGVDSSLKKIFDDYKWPGNIRELENIIENMLVNSDDNQKLLSPSNIPNYLKSRFLIKEEEIEAVEINENIPYNQLVDDFERKILEDALKKYDFNVSKTARKLDINRNSLIYKMDRLGIKGKV